MKNLFKIHISWLIILTIILGIWSFNEILRDNHKMINIQKQILVLETTKDSLYNDATSNIDMLKSNQKLYKKTDSNNINRQINETNKLLLENNSKFENELFEQKIKFDEEIKSLWTHQIEYFAIIIALLIGLIFFANLEHLAKEKMEKEIAKMTGEKVEDVRQNYKQFVKHNRLKKDSKIVVINKIGSGYSSVFKKIMKLYYVDLNIDAINVNSIRDVLNDDSYKSRLHKADLVIIENQKKIKSRTHQTTAPTENHQDTTTYWPLRLSERIFSKQNLIKYTGKIDKEIGFYTVLKNIVENDNCVENDNSVENKENIIREFFPSFKCTEGTSFAKMLLMIEQALPDMERSIIAKLKCNDTQPVNRTVTNCLDCFDETIQINNTLLTKEDMLINKLNGIINNLIKQKQTIQNNLDLINLADNICDINSPNPTAVFYYGTDNFPIDLVKPDRKHYVTYANASSQLYINILNMLKFKHEIENV